MLYLREITLIIGLLLIPAGVAAGEPVAADVAAATESTVAEPFQATWSRTDRPVTERRAERSWVWGSEPFTEALAEPYVDGPLGRRMVQYFDKARMEVIDPHGDTDSSWYVTNGLLVVEMMTGNMQIGDDTFRQVEPADISVIDAGDGSGAPTYADLAALRDTEPGQAGAVITERLDPSGEVTEDPALESARITAEYLVPETNHRIAGPFWSYMNASGTIWNGGNYTDGRLFSNPFFATGFPVTEAYWITVQADGATSDVLLQCFERRCLTYTPDNPESQRVESNDVGRHYYTWRYETHQFGSPTPFPDALLDLPQAEFSTGDGSDATMQLEVVASEDARACGLMHRETLPENQGMLFVFSESGTGGFWNRNTFIPLTLAWIDADGVIVDLTDMEPISPGPDRSPTTTRPDDAYRYVIEANQGWFADHGIAVGDRVDLSNALSAGQTAPSTICDVLGT